MTSLIRISDVDTLLLYTIHAYLKRIKLAPSLIVASIIHANRTSKAIGSPSVEEMKRSS